MAVGEKNKKKSATSATPSKSAAPPNAAKAAHQRQATPFAKSKAAKQTKAAPITMEKLEEEDEDEDEDEDDGDADESDIGSDVDGDDPTGSLAAQFEAASHATASEDDEDDNEDDSGDDDGDVGSEDEDSSDSGDESVVAAPAAKKQKLSASADSKSVSATQLTLATEKELAFHIKQLHRIMKKLRAFQIKKVVRKLKETKALNPPAAVLAALESDLELTKHFNLDRLAVYALRMHNLGQSGKKMNWSMVEPVTVASVSACVTPDMDVSTVPQARLKELLSLLLTSPATKKAVNNYITSYLKKQRKDKGREKKLAEIAEAASKRKEKEKKLAAKQEEREKKQKEENLKKKQDAAAADGAEATAMDVDSGSDSDAPVADSTLPSSKKKQANTAAKADEPAYDPALKPSEEEIQKQREAKRADKVAKREAAKKERAAAAAEAESKKAAGDDAASSDNDSDNDSTDSVDRALAPKAGKPSRVFGGLSTGQLVRGVISGVEKFGLFIEFIWKKKERKGLCHISMAADEYVKDISALYAKGDLVESIVTKLDERTGKISLGLKKSLFPKDHTPVVVHTSATAKPIISDAPDSKLSDLTRSAAKLESVFMDSLATSKPTDEEAAKVKMVKRFMVEVKGTGKQKSEKKNRLGQRERRKLITAVLGAEAIKQVIPEKSKGQSWKKKEKAADSHSTESASAPAPASGSNSSVSSALASFGSSDPIAYAGLNRREKRLRMHQEMAARGEAIAPEFIEQLKAGKFEQRANGAKPKKPTAAPNTPTHAATSHTAAADSSAHTATAAPSRGPKSTSAHKPAKPTPAAARSTPTPTAAPTLDETMHPSWLAKQAQAAKLAAAPKGKKITFD